MHLPRFYHRDLATGVLELDTGQSRHALASLRLRPGDPVELFDGRGGVARGKLAAESDKLPKKRRIAHVAVDQITHVPSASQPLTLVVAGCKGPRLGWMIEKLTELDVAAILLTDFDRSVVRVGDAHLDKLSLIAIEASKQCGRAWLPDIQRRSDLRSALAQLLGTALLIAEPAADVPHLAAWLQRQAPPRSSTAGVIGPEGGFSPEELEMLHTFGGRPVRLAPTTLRVETAAVAFAACWAASV